jgi:TRAP-type mannitol/chloroaromatic compound transport system permease small subunit
MAKGIKLIFSLIEAFTQKTSRYACLLVFVMMVTTVWEVVARYVFNNPTTWVWPVNRQLFGLFILFAGVYTTFKGGHIKIEIFYDHFPSKMKYISRLIALAALICFMGVLVWQASWMGWNAWMVRELSAGAFRIPLYPFKMLIPVFAFLFLLQGIAFFFKGEE